MRRLIRTRVLVLALILNILLLLVSAYKFFTLQNPVAGAIYLVAAIVWAIATSRFSSIILRDLS